MGMQRKPAVEKITFSGSATGVTRTGLPLDVSQFAIAGIHASPSLDGEILKFIDNGEWGAHLVLAKTLSEGFNPLTQDELLRFGPSMQLSFELENTLTGEIFLKLKS